MWTLYRCEPVRSAGTTYVRTSEITRKTAIELAEPKGKKDNNGGLHRPETVDKKKRHDSTQWTNWGSARWCQEPMGIANGDGTHQSERTRTPRRVYPGGWGARERPGHSSTLCYLLETPHLFEEKHKNRPQESRRHKFQNFLILIRIS